MRRLGRPELWLTLSLLALVGLGGSLIMHPSCVQLSERDRTSYGARPAWQAGFDAISAVCGVGLLTYDLDEDYTPLGRWVLAGLGLAGALLYLAAARHAAGRLWAARGERLPQTLLILAAFLALQVLVIPLVWAVRQVGAVAQSFPDAAWQAIATFSSLGWTREPPGLIHNWVYAPVALLAALGWPVWLLVRPSARHRVFRPRSLLVAVSSYVAFLALAAGAVATLEVPRGAPHGATDDQRLAAQPPEARYARSVVQVACAAGAGVPTEQLGDRGVSEGTKLVLSGVLLVGGLGGSASGGVKWALLLCVLAAGGAFFGRGPRRSHHEVRRRCLLAGITCAGAMVTFATVVALGLLVIETRTASRFQPPPTFGDALLDASSAVAGGNLSSGLTTSVTGVNLSSGMDITVDSYQYGMTWLMLAMLIGRVLPVLVLSRVADLRFNDAPPATPPLI